jgi:hypothetical protein
MFGADAGRVQRILGFLVVDPGDDADLGHALVALERALGRQALDLGDVGLALGQQLLLARQDLLARDLGFQLFVGRLFAFQGVGQVGRLQYGEHVALFHRIAGRDF